jgi:hypothetical protein
MNKEKKLTDEEIVKALAHCTVNYPSCEGCPLYNEKNCATKAIENTIALIHRLQDEKQKVVQDYYCEAQHCDVQKDIIEKQKAEIERLTEENKHLDKLLGEKRLDELNVAKQIVAQNCSLNEENAELQKQVDELTAFKNEAISMSLYGKGRKDGEAVAVKDTAKEILDDLRNIFIEQSSYGCDANQHIGYYDYVVKIGLVIEQVEEYAKLKYGIEYGVEVE